MALASLTGKEVSRVSREKLLAEYSQKIEEAYRRRTPKSAQLVEGFASKYCSDGDYRQVPWFDPYPPVMARGDGCHLYDVDGHSYIDLSNNWTAGVLGINPPKVLTAIREAQEEARKEAQKEVAPQAEKELVTVQ